MDQRIGPVPTQSTRNCTTGANTGRGEIERLEILGESSTVTITVWPLERGIGTSYLRRLWRGEVSRHLDDVTMRELETVVSELGTNAMVHTDGECEFRVVRNAGAPVLCEVADAGNEIELIAGRLAEAISSTSTDNLIVADGDAHDGDVVDPEGTVAGLSEGGLGLGIVAAFTHGKCGVRPTRLLSSGLVGKSVWFELPDASNSASRT
ncbi:hypothetical protein [Actinomadura violacea]|uniref:Histidine kinase/HSP90-like ATPase domain-containing protein n=1 Tax=Actinomadura violacea TaxID=2819934 RepID=A0ABS3RXQ4_9ACTN|nr:hypothetical protein [Actinomadura violacea]MBO2461540.1 hypothetical protein [Actinomadura violacea]